jgi:hypothetical protein
MNCYIINAILEYCLNENKEKFHLEDIYNYFNLNYDTNEFNRNILLLRNIDKLFSFRSSTEEFQLEIKVFFAKIAKLSFLSSLLAFLFYFKDLSVFILQFIRSSLY